MTPQLPFDSPVLLQFKTGLRELQNKLQELIERTEKEIREFADLGPLDAVDISCFSSSKESMFADSSRNRNQLQLVQRALERIRDGSFGICATCEGAIGLKRPLDQALHSMPGAIRARQTARLDGSLTSLLLPRRWYGPAGLLGQEKSTASRDAFPAASCESGMHVN